MVELEIKFKNTTIAKRFKRHLEETHPSIQGKIHLDNKFKRKVKIVGNRRQVNKMLRNTPDLERQAANFTQPI